ncbi:MAG: hypothetical protein ACTS5F_01190 [Candidatus Hodgkinia cicadicola]
MFIRRIDVLQNLISSTSEKPNIIDFISSMCRFFLSFCNLSRFKSFQYYFLPSKSSLLTCFLPSGRTFNSSAGIIN